MIKALLLLLVVFLFALTFFFPQQSIWSSQLSLQQQPVQATSHAHSFIYIHADTHTNTQPCVHLTPSLPRCVHLSPRATWQRTALPRHSTGIQSWLMACHTHDNTHTHGKRADALLCCEHTRQYVTPYLIEVSGVSAECVCRAGNGLLVWTGAQLSVCNFQNPKSLHFALHLFFFFFFFFFF